jgi:hypothetical protein
MPSVVSGRDRIPPLCQLETYSTLINRERWPRKRPQGAGPALPFPVCNAIRHFNYFNPKPSN